MNDEDLILVDDTKSVQWNYVERVDIELKHGNTSSSITMNPMLPKSYKEVIMVLTKACNHSRVALLIDDAENYVAFALIVDGDCIPFLLDPLDDITTPMTAVYKVFTEDELAKSKVSEGLLQDYIQDTVIPDLNRNFDSWKPFIVVDND